jgi:acetolactate synthase-1/2/3 large subunit
LADGDRHSHCIQHDGFVRCQGYPPEKRIVSHRKPFEDRRAFANDTGFPVKPQKQEIETALRMKTPIAVLIWNDAEYGLITWHQLRHYGRPSHIEFKNPDFVKYAESFGAKGYRVERAEDLAPTLRRAFADNTVVLIDCPVDYAENLRLTARLNEMKAPT